METLTTILVANLTGETNVVTDRVHVQSAQFDPSLDHQDHRLELAAGSGPASSILIPASVVPPGES